MTEMTEMEMEENCQLLITSRRTDKGRDKNLTLVALDKFSTIPLKVISTLNES
jgi:hypothetical protein